MTKKINELFNNGWKIREVSHKTLEKLRCDSRFCEILCHPIMWDKRDMTSMEWIFKKNIIGFIQHKMQFIRLK